MKTSIKKQDKCKVELTITLTGEETAEIVKNVEKAFVREARLPGFRPGKAPLELVRKEFAGQLKEEQARRAVAKYYPEAVKAEGLDELGLRDVPEIKVDTEGGLIRAVVEVRPEFKLPTYKGLKIKAEDTRVGDDKVAARIEEMRTRFAKYEDAKEGDAVAKGDFAQVDYTGTVDGKSILELAPDAKVVAEGKGFWMRVEEGYFLPELVEAVVGMKAGEEKTGIKAKFDKESAPEPLKGKKALYTLKLTLFRRRILPDDATLVGYTKDESMEALTAKVRADLEKQAIEAESARREQEAIELLLKKVDFEVPESQVQAQQAQFLNRLAQQAQYMGMTSEYVEQNKDKILKDAEENAVKQVRLWYLIDAIAKAENIEAKDEERGKKVLEFILANAK